MGLIVDLNAEKEKKKKEKRNGTKCGRPNMALHLNEI